VRKNISIHDRRTTIVLEQPVWDGLLEICRRESLSLDALCEEVIARRGETSMSSMLRITLLEYYRELASVFSSREAKGADNVLDRVLATLGEPG
jgi:predicted DNA-binding ribbon-helix-helix protein